MQRTLSKALTAPQPQERPPSSAGGCKASSEARVLVINTGGTIGMVQDDKGEGAGGERGRGAPGTGEVAGCSPPGGDGGFGVCGGTSRARWGAPAAPLGVMRLPLL